MHRTVGRHCLLFISCAMFSLFTLRCASRSCCFNFKLNSLPLPFPLPPSPSCVFSRDVIQAYDMFNSVVFIFRRMRSVGCSTHRESTGKVTVRTGGVRSNTVSQPTDALREAPPAHALTAQRQCASHWTVVLRAVGRQDSDWDAHTRHAPQWRQLQLALHGLPSRYSGYSMMTSCNRVCVCDVTLKVKLVVQSSRTASSSVRGNTCTSQQLSCSTLWFFASKLQLKNQKCWLQAFFQIWL